MRRSSRANAPSRGAPPDQRRAPGRPRRWAGRPRASASASGAASRSRRREPGVCAVSSDEAVVGEERWHTVEQPVEVLTRGARLAPPGRARSSADPGRSRRSDGRAAPRARRTPGRRRPASGPARSSGRGSAAFRRAQATAAGRVDMRDRRPGRGQPPASRVRCTRTGCSTSIGWPSVARRAHLVAQPWEWPGMLGEQADLPGLGRPQFEGQSAIRTVQPSTGRIEARPAPAAIPVEAQVGFRPATGFPPIAEGAAVRSVRDVVAEPLEAARAADVEEFVPVHGAMMAETGPGGPTYRPAARTERGRSGGPHAPSIDRRDPRHRREPVAGGLHGSVVRRDGRPGASSPASPAPSTDGEYSY